MNAAAWTVRFMGAALLAALATACSEDMPVEDPQDPEPPGGVTFRFRMHGDTQGLMDFNATTSDAALIVQARQQLQLPEGSRNLHINGGIVAASGQNLGWSWRFRNDGWQLSQVSIELCDGNAMMVEQNLAYWLNTVKRFCPWGSYVAGEVVGLAAASGIIVKFSVEPSPVVLEQRVQAMQQIAGERGLVLTYRSASAQSGHVLDLGWVISTEQTRNLGEAIVARVPDIEYAVPNIRMYHMGSP